MKAYCGLSTGVIVARVHKDKLEARNQKEGKDCYIFSVDNTPYVLDATNFGSICRFVNHSCKCAPLHVFQTTFLYYTNQQQCFCLCADESVRSP